MERGFAGESPGSEPGVHEVGAPGGGVAGGEEEGEESFAVGGGGGWPGRSVLGAEEVEDGDGGTLVECAEVGGEEKIDDQARDEVLLVL